MAEFKREKVDLFLGVVRKYMQVRGAMSQKDLAEQTDVGVSTMSRFLSQKSTEMNPQLIAKITAKLNIPLHEMIDFVEEDFADRFVRLVKFYKDELGEEEVDAETVKTSIKETEHLSKNKIAESESERERENEREKEAEKIKQQDKRDLREINKSNNELSIREKLESLTPRQRAFMTEFLNLKLEERDLIVDVGNNLFQYFKMKGMDL
jgi:transcriptional regulator with XRE-family HTH domain